MSRWWSRSFNWICHAWLLFVAYTTYIAGNTIWSFLEDGGFCASSNLLHAEHLTAQSFFPKLDLNNKCMPNWACQC